MAGSLRDQLLKSGLVDEKKAKQIAKEKRDEHRQHKQETKQTGKQAAQQAAAAAQQRAREQQAARSEKDREANRRKEEALRRKALRAEVRQLVDANRIERKDGDLPYRFKDGTRLEKIYVTATLQQRLARGELAIVRVVRRYDLVPPDVADRIRARDPEGTAAAVVTISTDTDTPAADDPYAQYQIPDDLTW